MFSSRVAMINSLVVIQLLKSNYFLVALLAVNKRRNVRMSSSTLENPYNFIILETKQLINESESYSSTMKIIIPAHAPLADAAVAVASNTSCLPSIHHLSWLWFRIMTSLNSDRKAGLVLFKI